MTHYLHWHPQETAIPRMIQHELWDFKRGYCMAMTGSTMWKVRTGKSWTACVLAKLVDPTFDVSRVVYRPTELLALLREFGQKKLFGRAIVVDEAEELVDNTEWQKAMNKAIAMAIATGGFRRAFIIWVTPTLDWITKKIRKLMNGWGSTAMNLNGEHNIECWMKFYNIGTDDTGENIFKHTPKFYDKEQGRVVYANEYQVTSFGDLFPELKEQYVEKSNAFKETLNLELYEIVKAEENAVLHNKHGVSENLTLLVDNAMNYPIVQTALSDKNKITASVVRYAFLNDGKTLSHESYKDIARGINLKRKQFG